MRMEIDAGIDFYLPSTPSQRTKHEAPTQTDTRKD